MSIVWQKNAMDPVNPAPLAIHPLSRLAPGTLGVVTEITLPGATRPRLMEMGLLVGATVELIRFAPLGDPMEIKIRGYRLSLRKHEAEHIWVRPTLRH